MTEEKSVSVPVNRQHLKEQIKTSVTSEGKERAAWRSSLGATLHGQPHAGVWRREEERRASMPTLLAQWLCQARKRQGMNKAMEGLEGKYKMGQLDKAVLERFKYSVAEATTTIGEDSYILNCIK